MSQRNHMPGGHSIHTISEEVDNASSRRSQGSSRSRSRERSSIKYIVADPNDVKYIDQNQTYPSVGNGQKNYMNLERPAGGTLGVVNTGFEGDEGSDNLTPAARARAERRSRRRQKRQKELEAIVGSPDTSSEDVAPYLNAQEDPRQKQPSKGIIKENKSRKLVQNGDLNDDGNKVFHLRRRGDEGYGFAYRNGKVSVVVPGGAAEKAGLRVGDKIIEVNGVNMEGQDKDSILTTISKNKKNLILVVLDENYTPSESSDLNDSASASEFSDSVDRSSGSSVRFQLEGRMNPLKPGESVASLDIVPARKMVNFDPDPKPSSKRHRRHANQRGVYPPPSNGHYPPRHQSPGRSSGRRRSRPPHSRSSSGSRSSHPPAPHSNSTKQNGSVKQNHAPVPVSKPTGNQNQAFDNTEESSQPVTTPETFMNIPLYGKPGVTTATSPVTEQPTPYAHSNQNTQLDMPDVASKSDSERKQMCCGTYKLWAAMTLIFCLPCIPLGALAFVYANKSNRAYDDNDIEKGNKLATTSGYFIAAGMLFGFMAWLGVICAVVFSGGGG